MFSLIDARIPPPPPPSIISLANLPLEAEGVTVIEPSELMTIAATKRKTLSLAHQLTVGWWSSACPQ